MFFFDDQLKNLNTSAVKNSFELYMRNLFYLTKVKKNHKMTIYRQTNFEKFQGKKILPANADFSSSLCYGFLISSY